MSPLIRTTISNLQQHNLKIFLQHYLNHYIIIIIVVFTKVDNFLSKSEFEVAITMLFFSLINQVFHVYFRISLPFIFKIFPGNLKNYTCKAQYPIIFSIKICRNTTYNRIRLYIFINDRSDITAPSPISTPMRILEPVPIHTSFPIFTFSLICL